MANSADPDQLASSEANWSGSTLFAQKPTDLDLHYLLRSQQFWIYTVRKGRVYPGSAGLELTN